MNAAVAAATRPVGWRSGSLAGASRPSCYPTTRRSSASEECRVEGRDKSKRASCRTTVSVTSSTVGPISGTKLNCSVNRSRGASKILSEPREWVPIIRWGNLEAGGRVLRTDSIANRRAPGSSDAKRTSESPKKNRRCRLPHYSRAYIDAEPLAKDKIRPPRANDLCGRRSRGGTRVKEKREKRKSTEVGKKEGDH